MYGEMDVAKNGDLTDVTKTELMTFAPLFVLVFVMGVFPQPFLRVMEPTVKHYVSTMESRRQGLKPALFQGGDAVVAYAQVNSRYNG